MLNAETSLHLTISDDPTYYNLPEATADRARSSDC